MKKIITILMVLFILFVLERLYLLPIYVPLDTKPNSRRSATYLAKTISKEAKCNNLYLEDIDYNKGDTILNFTCNFGLVEKNTYIPFYIHIFFNNKAKDIWINSHSKDSYREKCFKKGSAYIICDSSWSPNITLPKTKKHPISYGQKYYSRFPGEDITLIEKNKKDK